MTASVPRRRFLQQGLAFGAVSVLGGCGFHPVYMPTASGKAGPAAREMATVEVARIPDRPGQLLRQALQQTLHGATGLEAPRYMLAVNYSIAGEGIAIYANSTPTRIRLIGHADWTLASAAAPHAVVTRGSARAFDAVNMFDQQYFAADLESEAEQRRMARQIAEQIGQQLAVFFRKRAGMS